MHVGGIFLEAMDSPAIVKPGRWLESPGRAVSGSAVERREAKDSVPLDVTRNQSSIGAQAQTQSEELLVSVATVIVTPPGYSTGPTAKIECMITIKPRAIVSHYAQFIRWMDAEDGFSAGGFRVRRIDQWRMAHGRGLRKKTRGYGGNMHKRTAQRGKI